MANTITPLLYIGGKSMLSGWIIKHFPKHHTYVEAFGGSAAVLLRKDPAPVEIYNDVDSRLVNFFRVLRDPEKSGKLLSRALLTPYSVEEYYASLDVLGNGKDCSDIDMAYAYLVANRMAYSGAIGQGWGYSIGASSRGMSANVSKWVSAIECLPDVIHRFKTIQVECEDFRSLIDRYDTPDTLFYLDPEYYGVDAYEHGMTKNDHEDLIDIIIELDGMVVLSGYDNELYDELLDESWLRVDKDYALMAAKAERGSKRSKRIESLWLSPQVADWVEDQEIS